MLEGSSAPVVPSKPAVSQAKPPIRPISATAHTAADDDDLEHMDFDSFVRRENERERRAKRG
jgi:hypothetical protein